MKENETKHCILWGNMIRLQRENTKQGNSEQGIEIIMVHRTNNIQFSSVTQSCLALCKPMDCSMPGLPVHHQLLETPWTAAQQASLSITNSQSILKLMSIRSVMPSNYLILCRLSLTVSIDSPSICHEVMEPDAMILGFWMLSFKPTFSFSSFTFLKRLFSSYLLSAIKVVSSAYLSLLIFLPDLDSSLCSSSPGFLMMYSAYKLNKQGDNIQPWCTPVLIWNQSIIPCPVLTVAS